VWGHIQAAAAIPQPLWQRNTESSPIKAICTGWARPQYTDPECPGLTFHFSTLAHIHRLHVSVLLPEFRVHDAAPVFLSLGLLSGPHWFLG
jgi:hypothetical protein